ncbi:putative iron-regulated membrane protein [Variovorax sp. TBS-050B]|uniref:PepSY-associated TM helix domain-containing protein n=1 Tax=Variovorax sp. TBS-050B TaxID=2940551 RepID=UPI002476536A|nr:PepSY-associated TM helix domain-containing protein [Variovorax sp. TBS-050B]MDH6590318.1 putative iron-regulated membrane protein [Variovorax sp. TBS-050B]
MKAAAPRLRPSMAGLHTWTGLLFGWLLYAMFLTGAASYFREEISQWMRPELPALKQLPDAAGSAVSAIASLQLLAPGASQWVVELADERRNVVAASWRIGDDHGRAMLDPLTGKRLSARDTDGGEFFYYFHFSLHYLPRVAARWLVGLATMFMLVALVSGVITHKKIFANFFTFRRGKGQRSWLDAHNLLSVAALPFHSMITYTGLVTLMTLYMPWGIDSAPDPAQMRQSLRAEMTALLPASTPSGMPGPLPDAAAMVHAAERRWGSGRVARLIVDNPGDAASRVRIVRGDAERVSVSPRYLVFDGATGELRQVKDQVGPVAEMRGVLYGLHLARFADVATRWLYFLSSLAGAGMVATGLVLWTVKRRAKQARAGEPAFGFSLVERLNIAAIAGLPVAMAVFFWGNRLLPLALANRREWEIHLFFIALALALLYAIARPVRRAWVELFATAAVLFAALPVWNTLFGSRHLLASIRQQDMVFAGFELTALAAAAVLAAMSRKTAERATA